MITIAEEPVYQQESIALLIGSVMFIRALYPVEEHGHTYNPDDLLAGRFFVVRDDGNAVGCGSYVWRTADEVELRHIFIAAVARGMGYSKVLLAHIEQAAVADGVKKIVLETAKKQSEAIGLYVKFGYGHCAPYASHHDESVFMEKAL